MENVRDLIEKLQILPWDMPIDMLMIGLDVKEGIVRISYGTTPDNAHMVWLKDITPEMKDTINQLHRLAYERINARNKMIEIAKQLK